MEPAYKLLTVGEFLDACPNDQRHYELLDGMIVAMAPPGQAHQILHMNLAFELGRADTRLQLKTIGLDIPLAALYRGVPGLSANQGGAN